MAWQVPEAGDMKTAPLLRRYHPVIVYGFSSLL
jgi:hypothetical protein